MKNTLLISLFIAASTVNFVDPTHAAQTTCKTDRFGTVRCTGETADGQQIKTITRTDSFGTKRTTGKIGDQNVKQTCKTNSFGSTYCH